MKPLCSFVFVLFTVLPLGAADFFVSPTGSDANPGSSAAPFATISRARDAIRSLKYGPGLPTGGVTVWMHGGDYAQPDTLSFDGRDSGTSDRPIVYASVAGEQAHVTGARALDPAWFSLVTSTSPIWSRLDASARGQVYAVNLVARGISDLGTLKARGFVLRETAPLELFVNGRPMTLARWPNSSEPLARTAAAPSWNQVGYSGTRPERWTQAPDVWMHGLWSQTWADYHVSIGNIEPSTKTITFNIPPAQYGTAADRPYYAYNLLEEIDEPGEYYVDRSTGMLYLWPAGPLTGADILVSTVEASLVRFSGAQYITFRGLVLEASRGPLVSVESGDHVRIETSTLRNAGQFAAQIAGSNNGLDQCEIADCGEEGVRLSGGERASLVAGNNYVTNTHIQRTGSAAWTYKPGINFEGGCGNLASHNLLELMPHTAVLFTGNNHLIEANEITRVCQSTSDAGAIYSGHDWGYRGNVIRSNFIHHIATNLEGYGAHGVYLDDCVSGVEVDGNIFYRVSNTAIFCGGGRDNLIRNNLVALSGTAHHNDDRGRFQITDSPGDYWNLRERLSYDGIRYQSAPWSTAYPACAAIPNSWDEIQRGVWRNPQNTVFSDNAGWGNSEWTTEQNSSGTGVFSVYAAMVNNDGSVPALFDENASLNRGARAATLTAPLPGFQPIAFAAIGPSATPVPETPSTPAAPASVVPAGVVKVEAEDPLTVINDVGSNGTVGVSDGTLDSGQSVRLYDAGDAVRMTVSIPAAGVYQIGIRVRAGGTTGSTSLWPAGYRFKLDGAPLVAVGDATTLSKLDPAYGGCYWGTMFAAPITLTAGEHTVEVAAAANWAIVDFVQIAPSNTGPPPPPAATDTTPPVITVPASITVEATGASGAVVSFVTNATDGSGIASSSVTPASGSLFPLGTSVVTATATDNAGNVATKSFTVTVRDSTPPALTLPANLTLPATNADGAVATFAVSAFDTVSGAVAARATPASGSTFPVGTTTVSISASDYTGNTATGSFTVTVLPFVAAPPAGLDVAWVDGDVGSVNRPGSASGAGDAFTVSGSGADVWDSVIGFHYLYRSASGDASAVARVTSLQNTDGWAKAGWMMRETLDPAAPFAALYLTAGNGIAFQWRPSAGASCSSRETGGSAPAWVRLDRAGNTFTAFSSSDGTTWRQFASATITMGAQVYLGLAVTSHNAGALATATFDGVKIDGRAPAVSGVTAPPPIAPPIDLTAPSLTVPSTIFAEATGPSGAVVTFSVSASDSGSGVVSTTASPRSGSVFPLGTTTVNASAVDAAGNVANQTFAVVVRDTTPPVITVPADITLTSSSGAGAVAVFSPSAVDAVSGAVATRSTPASGSVFPVGTVTVLVAASDAAGNSAIGSFTVTVASALPAAPSDLIAVGADNAVQLAWSASPRATSYDVKRGTVDGGPYAVVASNVTATNFNDLGVSNETTYFYVVVAHTAGGTSAHSNQASATPSGEDEVAWSNGDVGNVNTSGTAMLAGGTFTLIGSGADIWESVVGFHYVYRAQTGDSSFVARVTSLSASEFWAKAGVMIRESLDPGAPFAGLYLTPGNGVAFQWRPFTWSACSSRETSGSGPTWLRLDRVGDTFVAFRSEDGANWQPFASATIRMSAKIYLGLAVTSHNASTIAVATFDSVRVSAGL